MYDNVAATNDSCQSQQGVAGARQSVILPPLSHGIDKEAEQILEILLPRITGSDTKFVITIAGESGCGKSEISTALSQLLDGMNIKTLTLQQDDYFIYPPITNAGMRREDINHVGLSEVDLAGLDRNLGDILSGQIEIDKPLVIFDDDLITRETINLKDISVIIVDGTYTTLLKNSHQHVFIDRTYIDTREARKIRAREAQDEFLERVLEIEHGIISSHIHNADIIVTRTYDVRKK